MVSRLAGGNAAVMTGNAGSVYLAVVHPGRKPPFDRMARLAGIRCRNVISRFTGGNAAVMAKNAGVADHAVINPSRFPCPGRVACLANIRCGHMIGRFAVDLFTVMAADALEGNNTMVHCHRQPFFSGSFVTGTAICRCRQMIFRLRLGNPAIMAFTAHVHGRFFMDKREITIPGVSMALVAG